MRVTFDQIHGNLDAINIAAAQYARAQEQVASGKRVQRPSDDPMASERAIQDSAEAAQLDGYSQASGTASDRLSVLDGALSTMTDLLTSALATASGGVGSTVNQSTRDTVSVELGGLRDSLAGAFNTKVRGVYVFAGSQSQTQPYANGGAGWAYSGDSSRVTVESAPNRSVAVSVDGQAIAKGGDTTDVFTALDTLAADIKAGNDDAAKLGIDALSRAFQRVTKAQTEVGTDESSVSDGQTQIAALRLAATKRLSNDQDVNMAEAITQMSHAQTAYQAALGAVGTASKQSLLDYLK